MLTEPDKRFTQFLVNCGLLDEEAIFDAMNIRKKQTIPIGKLALEEKCLPLSR
ncbi:MAG: hypothetical protein GY941_07000 [Planctomycetes bacterium]|nr:hypothetical protein [Planctomycetota bacterium]